MSRRVAVLFNPKTDYHMEHKKKTETGAQPQNGRLSVPAADGKLRPDDAIQPETVKPQTELSKLTDDELARAINTGHHDIDSAIHNAREHAMRALKAALQAGLYLEEVHRRCKAAGSKWRVWLKQHCPDLPESTAYRYKQLFKKFSHVRKPEEITNLSAAYVAVGILPKAPTEEQEPPNLDDAPAFSASDLVARVKKLRTFYEVNLRKFDVAALEQTLRDKLVKEVTALLKEFDEFRTSIERTEAKRVNRRAARTKPGPRKARKSNSGGATSTRRATK